MKIQDFIFYPHNDMENNELDIVNQHKELINAGKYAEAVELLENNNYTKGIRADLLNTLRDKILNLQDYTKNEKVITEDDYSITGVKGKYLGEYSYSTILSEDQWKYGNVFYCDFSSVFSSTSPNKGYWMITNGNVSADYKNYQLDLTTERFIVQPTVYQEYDLYYVEFYCGNPSTNTIQFLGQHIGEDIFKIADKVEYTYSSNNYREWSAYDSTIIVNSQTLRVYFNDENIINSFSSSGETSTFSFYTFTGNSLYPLHYYFSNSIDSNVYIKYLENYDPNNMITYSEGVYSSSEPTLTEMKNEIFWNKIIKEA